MDVTALSQEAPEATLGLHSVLSRTRHVDELSSYIVPDTDMEMGASLGNSSCWVTTKGTGDIENVFSTYLGQKVLGAVCIRYGGSARPLQLPFQEDGGQSGPDGRSQQDGQMQLYSQAPGTFEIHPAFQRHTYELPGEVQVEETVFVPNVTTPMQAHEHLEMASPVVYQVIRLRSRAHRPTRLWVYGYAQLQGVTSADISASYDSSLGRGALVARNESHPDWVRLFGVSGLQVQVAGFETGFDDREVYETTNVAQLDNDTSARGAILGALQVDVTLQPGKSTQFAFMTVFSHEGENKARDIFNATLDYNDALKKTVSYYNHMAEVSQVLTPDPQINLGVTWAKVNMLRVMANYPTGPAFTNDPSLSSAVVGRDVCWYTVGCDFFLPEFSRVMLESLAARQREDGLIVEYYHAVTDERAFNGFNINDNTPLFIWAAWHHYKLTKDEDFLQRIYPAVWKAGQCILRARDTELDEIPPERKRGLVTCTVRGVDVYGIASWRNIIPNYTLNGAVTEINAECAMALRQAAADLAEARGTPESRADASAFREAGEVLVQAINAHLINPKTGLYYLNIDLDGNIHTDVTADEIYPVMFEVAPDEVAARIVERLNAPDFWTTAGIRTVSRMSPGYDPYRQWGLMGGVWPGVAWWYAYAARNHHPEFTVQALRMSFEHYARDPKRNNTVPGQFSEWMDGESLANRGMRLSPWEPPRFVLAAIRGICGFTARTGRLTFHPHLPAEWEWVGLRRLPYRGREVSLFGVRQPDGAHVYGTTDFEMDQPVQKHLYEEEVTAQIDTGTPLAQVMAFKKAGERLVCLGSSASQTMLFPLRLEYLLEGGKTYQTEIYSSDRHQWIAGARGPGEKLREAAMQIEAGGYRLLRFQEQGT
jgi:glycogen debranching enzyme